MIDLWERMMEQNHWSNQLPQIRANVTLTEDVKDWPAGTRIRIVMASRFGDFGLTDRLDAIHGYSVRVMAEDAPFKDIEVFEV